MSIDLLKQGAILRGPLFKEPVQVIAVISLGDSIKVIGTGLKTHTTYQPVLTAEQISAIEITSAQGSYDGDATRFRLGVEAMRLKIAYEYDPYFSLSIARVDPLPHQLEAVYDNFIKLPRVRFLLADDPGAGKTVMAGLLLKEMKIRGLVKRTLIVTPANLTFQWQREMRDKFREQFSVIRSGELRANYGSNPWQDQNQVITSVSWVSRVEDARESLLRSHWDLIIVDEAHKMSAYAADKKTLAYELGEHLSQMTDHYLLMTATPHKGDPKHFCLFLQLLDKDVYGDVKSLDEAMLRNEAPFYLRRTKEALVTFPDPETGVVKKLFTKRHVDTVEFKIDADEREFYDALTSYVELQSIRASAANETTGRAVGFTMAMLQRRFASSVYAVRRSLERMRDKRQRILDDPEAHRQAQIAAKVPDDFEDLDEQEQADILATLEDAVASIDPSALKEEIHDLAKLIEQARQLEHREIETKLVKLKEAITSEGIFNDKKMKLLLFTEHKDTLDYLVAKLRGWGLSVTQIHGGMKIGDRDTPGTRIYSEREFREDCQVLVATEAAGEGINLQFCWFMVNYDIPWNPIRLEQRMGRIHRYGQEKDCLILNFVSTNTREGRVLAKLFERLQQIEADIDPQNTGKVFNVLGDIFPANGLERMLRDMYLRNETEDSITARIVEEVDTNRFRQITESTLEGLARRELNLSAIIGKSTEARERRLVPEIIENFFRDAAPVVGITPAPLKQAPHVYRVGKVPRPLWSIGEANEPEFGRLAREYKTVAFDKEIVKRDATLDWVTPGHPLFEAVRTAAEDTVRKDLERGAVFFDLHQAEPYHLDVFAVSIKDGRGSTLHRRLFVVQAFRDGRLAVRQPTILLDLAVAPPAATPLDLPLVDLTLRERQLIDDALHPFRDEVSAQAAKQARTIRNHLQISMHELIHRQNMTLGKLHEDQAQYTEPPNWLLASLKQTEDRIDELNARLERRLAELEQEEQCTIGDVQLVGSAWVLPHPDRLTPSIQPMVRDDDIERIAVEAVIAHENARGWVVESVEKDNRGFDLISRRMHPEDPRTAVEVRFIEVKGRAGVGEVALTSNEFVKAQVLKHDYWLYVVFNCASDPQLHLVRDPARLGWEPIVRVEHFHVGASEILLASAPAAVTEQDDKEP
jgi:superfamily II DNA or RNA helicase